MIVLCNPSVPKVSFGVALRDRVSFNDFAICPGDKVQVLKGEIIIKTYNFDLNLAVQWNARLKHVLPDHEKMSDFYIDIERSIITTLHQGGLGETFLSLLKCSGKRRLAKHNMLTEAMSFIPRNIKKHSIDYDYLDLTSSLKKLIGLGVGLTPSGDDFIVGLLSFLTVCENTDPIFSELVVSIRTSISNSLKNTTDVSSEFLYYACKNEFSELIHDLYEKVQLFDRKQVMVSMLRFCQFGHSSGNDVLCGIMFGLRLIQRRFAYLFN